MECAFGKDRYSEIDTMVQWCETNIGPGIWSFDTPKTWVGMGKNVWILHHQKYDKVTIAFKHSDHYIWFKLRWT